MEENKKEYKTARVGTAGIILLFMATCCAILAIVCFFVFRAGCLGVSWNSLTGTYVKKLDPAVRSFYSYFSLILLGAISASCLIFPISRVCKICMVLLFGKKIEGQVVEYIENGSEYESDKNCWFMVIKLFNEDTVYYKLNAKRELWDDGKPWKEGSMIQLKVYQSSHLKNNWMKIISATDADIHGKKHKGKF